MCQLTAVLQMFHPGFMSDVGLGLGLDMVKAIEQDSGHVSLPRAPTPVFTAVFMDLTFSWLSYLNIDPVLLKICSLGWGGWSIGKVLGDLSLSLRSYVRKQSLMACPYLGQGEVETDGS